MVNFVDLQDHLAYWKKEDSMSQSVDVVSEVLSYLKTHCKCSVSRSTVLCMLSVVLLGLIISAQLPKRPLQCPLRTANVLIILSSG